jgi:hypothetical protein
MRHFSIISVTKLDKKCYTGTYECYIFRKEREETTCPEPTITTTPAGEEVAAETRTATPPGGSWWKRCWAITGDTTAAD